MIGGMSTNIGSLCGKCDGTNIGCCPGCIAIHREGMARIMVRAGVLIPANEHTERVYHREVKARDAAHRISSASPGGGESGL